jgi:hypothetical protein
MKTVQATPHKLIQGDDMKPTSIEQLVHADEIYALIAKALIRAGA